MAAEAPRAAAAAAAAASAPDAKAASTVPLPLLRGYNEFFARTVAVALPAVAYATTSGTLQDAHPHCVRRFMEIQEAMQRYDCETYSAFYTKCAQMNSPLCKKFQQQWELLMTALSSMRYAISPRTQKPYDRFATLSPTMTLQTVAPEVHAFAMRSRLHLPYVGIFDQSVVDGEVRVQLATENRVKARAMCLEYAEAVFLNLAHQMQHRWLPAAKWTIAATNVSAVAALDQKFVDRFVVPDWQSDSGRAQFDRPADTKELRDVVAALAATRSVKADTVGKAIAARLATVDAARKSCAALFQQERAKYTHQCVLLRAQCTVCEQTGFDIAVLESVGAAAAAAPTADPELVEIRKLVATGLLALNDAKAQQSAQLSVCTPDAMGSMLMVRAWANYAQSLVRFHDAQMLQQDYNRAVAADPGIGAVPLSVWLPERLYDALVQEAKDSRRLVVEQSQLTLQNPNLHATLERVRAVRAPILHAWNSRWARVSLQSASYDTRVLQAESALSQIEFVANSDEQVAYAHIYAYLKTSARILHTVQFMLRRTLRVPSANQNERTCVADYVNDTATLQTDSRRLETVRDAVRAALVVFACTQP